MSQLTKRIERLETAPRVGMQAFAFLIRDDDCTAEKAQEFKAVAKRNGQIVVEISPDDVRL